MSASKCCEASPGPEGRPRIELTNGRAFETRAGLVATGVHYRRLDVPSVEERLGAGIHYAAAPNDAVSYTGRDVAVVGAANSAGQAALHLSDHARKVTLVARGGSPARSMSHHRGRAPDRRRRGLAAP